MAASTHPHHHKPGRHELGQNFLTDPKVIAQIVGVAEHWPGDLPIVELGAGDGALTVPLHGLVRVVTAVDLDAKALQRLSKRVPDTVVLEHNDLLNHRIDRPSAVVSNVPFHLTTPLLRAVLGNDQCRRALLLVQWEVARKRAGVGGATQLTAQWWPWVDVTLVTRVPAAAFSPRP